MTARPFATAAIVAAALACLGACDEGGAPTAPGARVELRIAPLDLPGVSDPVSSFTGDRSAYDESKLWGINTPSMTYQERIWFR